MKRQYNPTLAVAAWLVLGLPYPALATDTQAYLKFNSAQVAWAADGKEKRLAIDWETQQPIPMDGQSGAFGYAALSNDANNVLVFVTHLPIDDSSYEQNPSGWHTHVLDLKLPTAACKEATFEVDLENSKKNVAFDANYSWSVNGNRAKIKDVATSALGDAGMEAIVSFKLKPVQDARGIPSNLCIYVVDKL